MAQSAQNSAATVGRMRQAKKAGDLGVLAEIALDDQVKPPLRLSCVKALRKAGDVRAAKPLTGLVAEPNLAIRIEALKALRDLGGPDATGALVGALTSGSGKATIIAADGLGRLKAEAAVPGLVEHLGHREWKVRKTVGLALSRIEHPDGLEALRTAAAEESGRGKRKVLERFATPSAKR